MILKTILAAALAAAMAVAAGVTELTADTHRKLIETSDNAIVLYYVPWCHWCRRFLPMFDEIAAAADAAFKPLTSSAKPEFAKINLHEKRHSRVMEEEGVLSFPTLKLHLDKGNSSEVYDGEHHFNTVLTWLLERTTSRLEIESPDQLNALLKLHHSDVVCILVNPTKEMETVWNSVAKRQEHLMFGVARGEELSRHILQKFAGAHVTDDDKRVEWLTNHLKAAYIALFNPHYYDDDPDRFTYDQSHREYLAHLFPEEAGQEQQLLNGPLIDQFVSSYQFPAVARWTPAIGSKLVDAGRPFLIAFRHLDESIEEQLADPNFEANDKQLVHTETVLYNLGQKYRRNFSTVLSGIDHFYERRIMNTLGVEKGPRLVFVTINPTGSGVFSPTLKYYAPPEVEKALFNANLDVSEASALAAVTDKSQTKVEEWVRQVLDKKVTPNIKSEEPLPEDINNGPVRHVVATSFNDDVLATNLDVLVDFFAPWCGHCRVLAPLYERVAKAFKQANVHTIRLAKMDATANEVGGIHLIGYPTLILYPSGKKDHPNIHHGGINDGEALIRFLAMKVTHKFDVNRVLHAYSHPKEDDDLPRLAGEL